MTKALNGPGPRDPDFLKFCGALDFNRLSPEAKMTVWRRYEATKASPVLASEKIRSELRVRFGHESNAPAIDRQRLELALGAERQAAQPPAQPSQLSPAERIRSDAVRTLAKLQAEKAGIASAAAREGSSATLNLRLARESKLAELDKAIAEITRRHGLP